MTCLIMSPFLCPKGDRFDSVYEVREDEIILITTFNAENFMKTDLTIKKNKVFIWNIVWKYFNAEIPFSNNWITDWYITDMYIFCFLRIHCWTVLWIFNYSPWRSSEYLMLTKWSTAIKCYIHKDREFNSWNRIWK